MPTALTEIIFSKLLKPFLSKVRYPALCAAASAAFVLSGCPKNNAPGNNAPGAKKAALASADYDAAVRAFYTGTIAFQVGNDARADKELTRATQVAPDEAAAWANLGLFRMRQGNLAEAQAALDKAVALAPQSSPVALLFGILLSRQGKFDQAIQAFQTSAQADKNNLRARYALAQTVERQGGSGADNAYQEQMAAILELEPRNLLALLESARAAARAGDKTVLEKRVREIAAQTKGDAPEMVTQVKALQAAAGETNPRRAAIEAVKLKNVLARLPRFRTDSEALELSARDIAPPVAQFLNLPAPPNTFAPPDTGLTFAAAPLAGASEAGVVAARTIPINDKVAPVILVMGKTAQLSGKPSPVIGAAGAAVGADAPNCVAPLDTNADYQMDLAWAGPKGFRLLLQKAGAWRDATAQAKLPASITNAAYAGVWAADTDADGDLDMVLGNTTGTPTVLQNNGDGTWKATTPFTPVTSGLRGFVWADARGDGVSDAALIDMAGVLHVLKNNRGNRFTPRPVPQTVGKAQAVSAADADGDGLLDFIVWGAGGQVTALCDAGDDAAFRVVPLFQTVLAGANPRLVIADFDSNGVPDYVVSAGDKSEVWLSDEKHVPHVLAAPLPFAACDVILPDAAKTDLALVGVASGKIIVAKATGTKKYYAQILKPRAAENAGDQRINSFGVGGEVEIRAGLLYQKLPILSPSVRVGLGTQPRADYARILWPNGSNQGEFDLQANQVFAVEQRLKGSCPFLFAWNGKEMAFVTDCIWRSPLGLRINAQNTAGVAMTEDRVKLRADQMVARNGFYDVAVTAELWETHYFDHLSLMTVDHPENTDIWVDERFAIPPPPLAVSVFAPAHPIASAHDDKGADVTAILRNRDTVHLDTFGRGPHQGITRDHFVEIDLGPDIPRNKPLYLIASGWIHPTDSSTNIAVAQGSGPKPSGLALEVQNENGTWKTAKPALGFPSGKVKTVLIRLDDVLPKTSRTIRLRTNLEIYWDQIQWAEKLPEVPRTQKLKPSKAELYYRGFPVVKAKDASSPELPVSFTQTQGTAPLWRDLVGYCTRFGDIRELIAGVDDRYVIMNAGDAMRLRFPVPPPPPAGYRRDFVMVSDGWEKDGDYNTGFGRTVLPLPSHNNPAYNDAPARLEDDPVYKKHASDWQTYHTRYVTPRPFVRALVP